MLSVCGGMTCRIFQDTATESGAIIKDNMKLTWTFFDGVVF